MEWPCWNESPSIRFLLKPGRDGLADPVFRVSGRWSGSVTASSEGQAVRDLAKVPDGSVVFVIPGVQARARWVEVTGPTRFPGER